MAARPLVRRSSRLRSPPPRVLRRSRWRNLSSKRLAATKLSHNERTKADWPLLQKRGPFFAPNKAVRVRFGARLGRNLVAKSTYSLVNPLITAGWARWEQDTLQCIAAGVTEWTQRRR